MNKKEPIVRIPATPLSLVMTALKVTKRPRSRVILMAVLKRGLFDECETHESRRRIKEHLEEYNMAPDGTSLVQLPNGIKPMQIWRVYNGARYSLGRMQMSLISFRHRDVCVKINITDKYHEQQHRHVFTRMPCVRVEYGNGDYEVIGWGKLKKYLIPLRCEVHWVDGVDAINALAKIRSAVKRIAIDKFSSFGDVVDGEYLLTNKNYLITPHLNMVLVRYTDATDYNKILDERTDFATVLY